MADEKLVIGLNLPGEGIAEAIMGTVGKFRETQSPFVRDYFDLWGIEILMNLRANWLAMPGNKWVPLPELDAHIAKMKEGKK